MRNILVAFLFFSLAIKGQEIKKTLPTIFDGFPHVRDFAMSKKQDEIYFTVQSFKKEYSFIAVVKRENNQWSKPKVASFSGKFKDLEPFLSPNGLKLYFATNRINNNATEIKKDIDIWFVERNSISESWSAPKNIGPIINTSVDEFYPSVTNNGDLFFTAAYKDAKGKEDIYVSRLVNGKYTKPTSLSTSVNSDKYEFNAYVSPDESFIIFTSYGRKDGFGGGDLYISFKDEKNLWTAAKNLGNKVNSIKIDYCPFVDFNTNTLYYTSERSEVPTSFSSKKNIDELLHELLKQPNGIGRVYQTSFLKILELKEH